MKIINKSKSNAILAEDTEVAKSYWKKSLGLMFRKEIKEGGCFLMCFGREDKYGIWMLGMRFPIDIIFLDRRKRVVSVHKNVRPVGLNPATWRVYRPSRPAMWVLELKAGTASKSGTAPGDILRL